MAFQKTVKQTQALGSAGQISKAFHNYCNTFSAVVAEADGVCVGCFVQSTDTDGKVKRASDKAINGKILGVVVKDKYISSCGTDAVDIYKQGDNVTILNAGNIFIEAKVEAKQGKYVFLKNDNGTLVFNDTNTLSDHTYTGFRVSVGNKAPYTDNGIIEITTANA